MIEEISNNSLIDHVDDFSDPQAEMVLASVVEGNSEAQLWKATQPGHEAALLLWDKGNNVFYLSGDLHPEKAKADLAVLINTEIKDKAIKEGLTHFKVRSLSESSENALATLFGDVALSKTGKRIYAFQQPQVNAVSAPRLENMTFQLIDSDLLEQVHLRNNEYLRAEIEWMWSSLDRFCQKGFGIAALLAERIIYWCTAEYVSSSSCGIGIETERRFENQGIATATAAHFVDYCLKHAIRPHWECDSEHVASIRVAEKVGFDLVQEVPFIQW